MFLVVSPPPNLHGLSLPIDGWMDGWKANTFTFACSGYLPHIWHICCKCSAFSHVRFCFLPNDIYARVFVGFAKTNSKCVPTLGVPPSLGIVCIFSCLSEHPTEIGANCFDLAVPPCAASVCTQRRVRTKVWQAPCCGGWWVNASRLSKALLVLRNYTLSQNPWCRQIITNVFYSCFPFLSSSVWQVDRCIAPVPEGDALKAVDWIIHHTVPNIRYQRGAPSSSPETSLKFPLKWRNRVLGGLLWPFHSYYISKDTFSGSILWYFRPDWRH